MEDTMNTSTTELPSYLQLPPAATCAGCGRSALAECRDDLQQHNHYLCTLCTDKNTPPTPLEIGHTAGQAIGRMFFAAKDLLIELSEALEQISRPENDTAEGRDIAHQAATTLNAPAPPEDDPLGPRPLLTTEHGDGLIELATDVRDRIEQLLEWGRTPIQPSESPTYIKAMHLRSR